ncbi:hypothetical protein GQ44DRAFT_704456, partial [Phaeosphaeriaceae sp. PMI808]
MAIAAIIVPKLFKTFQKPFAIYYEEMHSKSTCRNRALRECTMMSTHLNLMDPGNISSYGNQYFL